MCCMPGMSCVNLWLAVRYSTKNDNHKWVDILFYWKMLDVGNKHSPKSKSNSNPDTIAQNVQSTTTTNSNSNSKTSNTSNTMSRTITQTPPTHTFHVTDKVCGRTDDWWHRCNVWIFDCPCDLFSSSDSECFQGYCRGLEWHNCQFIHPSLWSQTYSSYSFQRGMENLSIGPTIYINCINTLLITWQNNMIPQSNHRSRIISNCYTNISIMNKIMETS